MPEDVEAHKCEGEYQGCEGTGKLVYDPFSWEIYDEKVWIVLCDNCYRERCDEI